jgi:hypothetical protein
LKAFKTFFISIQTVKTQTQPGTGVILFQTMFINSVSASQYTFPSITVNHTSITIHQNFIMSTFKSSGFQAATITISEIVVYLLRCFVLLLQLITVAHAFISREVVGFQTILLLQITVTTFDSKFIFK